MFLRIVAYFDSSVRLFSTNQLEVMSVTSGFLLVYLKLSLQFFFPESPLKESASPPELSFEVDQPLTAVRSYFSLFVMHGLFLRRPPSC